MKLLNRKLIIQIILVIGLIFSNNNLIFAEDASVLYTEGDFQYYIVDGAIEIVKYNGDDSTVNVPYKFGVNEVKSIKEGAFTGSPATKIIIHDNISHYDSSAFNPGTVLVFNDVSGNEVSDPTGNYVPPIIGNNSIGGNNDVGNEENIVEEEDTGFEDEDIDIAEDLQLEQENIQEEKENNEENNNSIRKRVSELFDASRFGSNFVANKTGYIIIGVSVLLIIGIIIFYNKQNNEKR